MDTADINARIAAFNDELRRMAADGDGRNLLAWTGEQLAQAGEQLRQAPESERPALALYLMYVARPHISCLYDASMPLDALATALMVLMTCLLAKVDPGQIPVGYVAFVQNIFALSTALANDPRYVTADADGHLARITAMLGALANATVDAFRDKNLPQQFLDVDAAITADISSLAPSERTLDGRAITSTMALDVAADSIARLRSLGLEI